MYSEQQKTEILDLANKGKDGMMEARDKYGVSLNTIASWQTERNGSKKLKVYNGAPKEEEKELSFEIATDIPLPSNRGKSPITDPFDKAIFKALGDLPVPGENPPSFFIPFQSFNGRTLSSVMVKVKALFERLDNKEDKKIRVTKAKDGAGNILGVRVFRTI